MNGHHLILGQLTDFLSGTQIDDTHDERFRQKIARLLVDEKHFAKHEIRSKSPLTVAAGPKKAVVYIDFVVSIEGVPRMMVAYGPGSIVTREQPALAASCLIASHRIEVVVVTNGLDAVVLEGSRGKTMGNGLSAVPTREALLHKSLKDSDLERVSPRQRELASRILYAYEVDGRCPCDDGVCIL